MSILCDGLRASYFPPSSGTHRSTPYAANFGAINENWLPNQQRVPSPPRRPTSHGPAASTQRAGAPTPAVAPRAPSASDRCRRTRPRPHPRRGSTTFRAFAICQARDVAGSWLSSVEQRLIDEDRRDRHVQRPVPWHVRRHLRLRTRHVVQLPHSPVATLHLGNQLDEPPNKLQHVRRLVTGHEPVRYLTRSVPVLPRLEIRDVQPRVRIQNQPGRREPSRECLALPRNRPTSNDVHTNGRSIRRSRASRPNGTGRHASHRCTASNGVEVAAKRMGRSPRPTSTSGPRAVGKSLAGPVGFEIVGVQPRAGAVAGAARSSARREKRSR